MIGKYYQRVVNMVTAVGSLGRSLFHSDLFVLFVCKRKIDIYHSRLYAFQSRGQIKSLAFIINSDKSFLLDTYTHPFYISVR